MFHDSDFSHFESPSFGSFACSFSSEQHFVAAQMPYQAHQGCPEFYEKSSDAYPVVEETVEGFVED
jgi:hypothetical protein